MEYNYYNNPPDTPSPNLVLPSPIYDKDKNLIPPGIYGVDFSKERNLLFLIQSNQIKAVLHVKEIINSKTERTIPVANATVLSPKQLLIIYKEKTMEVHSTLDIP